MLKFIDRKLINFLNYVPHLFVIKVGYRAMKFSLK